MYNGPRKLDKKMVENKLDEGKKLRKSGGIKMKRNRHSSSEKAKIVLEVFRGEKTLSEIASENNIHPNLLSKWKKTVISGLPQLFEDESIKKRQIQKAHEAEVGELYKQIGKLTTELEWLKKKSGRIGMWTVKASTRRFFSQADFSSAASGTFERKSQHALLQAGQHATGIFKTQSPYR